MVHGLVTRDTSVLRPAATGTSRQSGALRGLAPRDGIGREAPVDPPGLATGLSEPVGTAYPRSVADPSDARPNDKSPAPRDGPDRRHRPTPMLTRYLLFGRRRSGRRGDETERVYVDRPGPWITAAFLLLTTLSAADAFFTLHELSLGATEANPIMRAALELGNGPFVIIKTIVTVVGAGFLALHKNWTLGRRCLGFALGGYVALTGYHLWGLLVVLPSGGS